MQSRKLMSLILLTFGVFTSGLALAQEKPEGFPKRPIEVVVPFGPGGGSDIFARMICMGARRDLGADLVVVNKPGAGALLGINYILQQPADGHTLYMGGLNLLVLNYIQGKTSIKHTAFQPILRAHVDITLLQTRYDGKYQTIQDVVADAKSNPGKVTVGVIGDTLAPTAVSTGYLCNVNGIKLNFVPYDRAGKMHAALLGGHIDLMTDEPGSTMELIETKKLRPLVVFAEERLSAFPDVPSAADLGAPEATNAPGRGIAVKAGTPIEIVNYLNQVFKRAMETELYKKYEESNFLNLRAGYLGPEDTMKWLAEEDAFLTSEYKKLGAYNPKK